MKLVSPLITRTVIQFTTGACGYVDKMQVARRHTKKRSRIVAHLDFLK